MGGNVSLAEQLGTRHRGSSSYHHEEEIALTIQISRRGNRREILERDRLVIWASFNVDDLDTIFAFSVTHPNHDEHNNDAT
jgi:hypothetical protein